MRSIIFGLVVLALSVSNAFANCGSDQASCTSMCVVSSALTKQFGGGNACINNCLTTATACEAREDQQRQMEQQRQQMQQQQQAQQQQQQAQQQQQRQQAAERQAQQERDAKEIGGKQQRVQQANEVAQRVGAEAAIQQQFDAAMEKGLQALDQKGYLSAEYQFKAALKIKPKDVDAKSGLLRAIVGSGRRPAAITYANEQLLALAAQPPSSNGQSAYTQWLAVLGDNGLANDAERSQLERIYPFGGGDPESAAAAFLRSNPKSLFIPFVRQIASVIPAMRADYADRRAKEAAQPEELQSWTQAATTSDVATLQAFLDKYPAGLHAAQARTKLDSKKLEAELVPGKVFKECNICPELVVIPAGTFNMGSNDNADQKPPHGVTIKSFAAGKYAITKAEFAHFVAAKNYQTEAEQGDGCSGWTGDTWKKDKMYHWRNLGFSQSDEHPVACVSWNDANAYALWVSQASGRPYRLLSEAEREYATRAGTTSPYWWGDTASHEYANYGKDACCGPLAQGRDRWEFTAPVGQFPANTFGLYDMSGNVWEWAQDCYHDSYSGAPADGSAWTTGCSENFRVLRGGSWYYDPAYLRSTIRYRSTPDYRYSYVGFRLARTLFTP